MASHLREIEGVEEEGGGQQVRAPTGGQAGAGHPPVEGVEEPASARRPRAPGAQHPPRYSTQVSSSVAMSASSAVRRATSSATPERRADRSAGSATSTT